MELKRKLEAEQVLSGDRVRAEQELMVRSFRYALLDRGLRPSDVAKILGEVMKIYDRESKPSAS